MINVGINGFGRIGRAIFRKNLKSNIFRVVAINDTNPSVENLIYMLKYDSTYGVLNEDIKNECINIFSSIGYKKDIFKFIPNCFDTTIFSPNKETYCRFS